MWGLQTQNLLWISDSFTQQILFNEINISETMHHKTIIILEADAPGRSLKSQCGDSGYLL